MAELSRREASCLSNDEFLVIMTCVDIMTNFITPWCVYDMTHFECDKRFGTMTYVFGHHDVCWHHDELYNTMMCLWHDTFWMWQTFWHYDVCYTYSCHDKVLTSWNFLTTWHTFWRLDALFGVMSNLMTSWCVFTFCWHDVFLNPWPAFCRIDFFFKFQEHNIMKTCFWYYDKILDVMICFSWRVFVFMTNCLRLWRIFDFMTHFLTSWHIFYFMTNLWRHDKLFDVMVCFWCHDALCDAMTNLVTSWQTWWRHYTYFILW